MSNSQYVIDQQVARKIAEIASFINSPEIFRERARLATQEFPAAWINRLPAFFHKPPQQPDEVRGQFTGLGDWMAACQFAIFEILYNVRESALPLLRKVAFGPYDWTQANAIDILCRFAMEGIEREQIDKELSSLLSKLRYEAIMYSKTSLAQVTPFAPLLTAALRDLIREYISESDPIDALELIEPLAIYNPQVGREYASFLHGLVLGQGLENRSPFMDSKVMSETNNDGSIHIVAMSGPSYPAIVEFHAIRAALILYRMFPDDQVLFKRLQQWAETHPDESIRKDIAGYL